MIVHQANQWGLYRDVAGGGREAVPGAAPAVIYFDHDPDWPAGPSTTAPRPADDPRGYWVLEQSAITGRRRLDYETWAFGDPGGFYVSDFALLEWTLIDQIKGRELIELNQLPARDVADFIADSRVAKDATAFTQRYEIAGPDATQAYTSTGGTSFVDTYPALAEMYWARNVTDETGQAVYLKASILYDIAREVTARDRAEYRPYDRITGIAANMVRRIKAIPLTDPQGKLALFGYLMTTNDPGGWTAIGGGA